MKLETAKKLKFGDRVFVKHSCTRTEAKGAYTTVHEYGSFNHEPCYGESGNVNIKCSGGLNGEFITVNHKDLKRVNVLPKDCVAGTRGGTKVRIKSDADSSFESERGKVVEIIELNKRYSSPFYGHAKVTCSSYGHMHQHVKLSELELYYE